MFIKYTNLCNVDTAGRPTSDKARVKQTSQTKVFHWLRLWTADLSLDLWPKSM